jgi:actin-like ATPase involved in cell morphogenesis
METLSQTPPELLGIYNTGFILLVVDPYLEKLDKEFHKNRLTCLHCRRSFRAVVRGTGMALKIFQNLKVS